MNTVAASTARSTSTRPNATATFTFSGDTFTRETSIGGRGANDAGTGYGGIGGSASGLITNNNLQPAIVIQNCTVVASVDAGGCRRQWRQRALTEAREASSRGRCLYERRPQGEAVPRSPATRPSEATEATAESVAMGVRAASSREARSRRSAISTTISNSSFTGNQTLGGDGGNAGAGGDGGAGGPLAGGAIYVYAGFTVALPVPSSATTQPAGQGASAALAAWVVPVVLAKGVSSFPRAIPSAPPRPSLPAASPPAPSYEMRFWAARGVAAAREPQEAPAATPRGAMC